MSMIVLLVVPGWPARADTPVGTDCSTEAEGGTPGPVIASLKRGFNLQGWLNQSRPRRPDPALLASLARLGFTHVRLPFSPQLLFSNFETSFLNELDFALDQLIGMGFTVSLDNHPGSQFTDGYEEKPDDGYARLLRAWMAIADRVKSRKPDKVLFDLWNEPQIDASLWREHATKLIGALRAVDPDRTVVFGEAPYQRYEPLIEARPLPFKNVVYAIHYYDPMTFTHQGSTWFPGPLGHLKGVPFPALADDARLKKIEDDLIAAHQREARDDLAKDYKDGWTAERIGGEFAKMGAWAKANKVHIIINEFGAYKGAAPPDSRQTWIKTVRQAAEANCMGWTHWELLDGFGFVGADGRTLDTGVTDALLTR